MPCPIKKSCIDDLRVLIHTVGDEAEVLYNEKASKCGNIGMVFSDFYSRGEIIMPDSYSAEDLPWIDGCMKNVRLQHQNGDLCPNCKDSMDILGLMRKLVRREGTIELSVIPPAEGIH